MKVAFSGSRARTATHAPLAPRAPARVGKPRCRGPVALEQRALEQVVVHNQVEQVALEQGAPEHPTSGWRHPNATKQENARA